MTEQKKILLIDDNRAILRAMKQLLTGEGYLVFATSNCEAAIRIAAEEQPDLVISDVDMPDMDGGEVAARLKESPKTRHIKVIFLTSMVMQDEAAAAGGGKNVYISKMAEHAEILAEIRNQLP
ncbi:MAG: response regulator [Deferribacteres bacterium]|nr:response regulator [Deferribacteres bacterium]